MIEKKIIEMDYKTVLKELDKINLKKFDQQFIKDLSERFMDYCNDRYKCNIIQVSYNNIDSDENVSKMLLYAYYKELEFTESIDNMRYKK